MFYLPMLWTIENVYKQIESLFLDIEVNNV